MRAPTHKGFCRNFSPLSISPSKLPCNTPARAPHTHQLLFSVGSGLYNTSCMYVLYFSPKTTVSMSYNPTSSGTTCYAHNGFFKAHQKYWPLAGHQRLSTSLVDRKMQSHNCPCSLLSRAGFPPRVSHTRTHPRNKMCMTPNVLLLCPPTLKEKLSLDTYMIGVCSLLTQFLRVDGYI